MAEIAANVANQEAIVATPAKAEDTISNQTTPEALELSAPTEQLSAVPEKFVGKTAAEVIEMYRNLESHVGKVSSEKAQREKELEEERQRRQALESQAQNQFSQRTVPQQQQVEDKDPLQEFDKKFEEDPRTAIREGFKSVQQKISEAKEQAYLQAQSELQKNRYEQMKKDNSDFAELEPEMVKIANQVGPYLHPAFRNSPQAVEMMYGLAKGNNIQKYVKAELDKASKTANLVRDEKKKAFSESATGVEGSGAKSPSEMTLKELEAYLGRSDK